jgi:hypothetical protein
MNRELLSKILSLLERQKFADWYNTGNFDAYITGDMEHSKGITYEEAKEIVLTDLQKMLD